MRHNLVLLSFVAWFLTSVSSAVAQSSSEQCRDRATAEREVLAVDAMRIGALLRNDVTLLQSITDDDYIHVESSGNARNKAQFIAGRRGPGRVEFSTFVIDENTATIFCNVAVLAGAYHNSYRTSTGSSVVKCARHLRVYVFKDQTWKNVAHQATDVQRTD